MLLVVASRLEDQGHTFIEHCRRSGLEAALITADDLSRPGWRLRLGHPDESRAALSRGVIRGCDVTGVLNLLPWITVHDLPHIAPDDRDYVANEMTAFLLAWLSQLACPQFDRPTPSSLCGCGRWPGEWARLAGSVGAGFDANWPGEWRELTVLERCVIAGAGEETEVAAAAVRLATAGRRTLVSFRFACGTPRPTLIGALSRPSVASAEVAEALVERFRR